MWTLLLLNLLIKWAIYGSYSFIFGPVIISWEINERNMKHLVPDLLNITTRQGLSFWSSTVLQKSLWLEYHITKTQNRQAIARANATLPLNAAPVSLLLPWSRPLCFSRPREVTKQAPQVRHGWTSPDWINREKLNFVDHLPAKYMKVSINSTLARSKWFLLLRSLLCCQSLWL